MLGDQQGEIGVLGVLGRILVAVAVDGDDAVGVLVDHDAVGVHAEGAHQILELLRAVDDLALVDLIGQVGPDIRRQFHPHADVHTVGLGGDVQPRADRLHPLAAAAAHGDDALLAGKDRLVGVHRVAALLQPGDGPDGGVEVEVHLVLQLVIQVLQHHIVDVGAQVAHLRVQQMQTVLQAFALDGGVGGGVKAGVLAAVAAVDLVHVVHELDGLLLAHVLKERAAELVGDVVFAVGEGACAAKAAHNAADRALDAALDLLAVDGALALGQGTAQFKHRDFQGGLAFHELIGGENAAGARADDDYVVFHGFHPF